MIRWFRQGALSFTILLVACSEGSFTGGSGRGAISPPKKDPTKETPSKNNDDPSGGTPDHLNTDDGTVDWIVCSKELKVPGRANPYFAGTPAGASISYNWAPNPDRSDTESPTELLPGRVECLKEGAIITFNVSGQISHGGAPATDADGKLSDIQWHQKGAMFGKSNVRAPLNSMMAVFTGDAASAVAPAGLDFISASSRDYSQISPLLGQIFFVGDGKRSNGQMQEVVVPAGAKRLFLGIMDAYEWNNNSGELSGGFSIKNK